MSRPAAYDRKGVVCIAHRQVQIRDLRAAEWVLVNVFEISTTADSERARRNRERRPDQVFNSL